MRNVRLEKEDLVSGMDLLLFAFNFFKVPSGEVVVVVQISDRGEVERIIELPAV